MVPALDGHRRTDMFADVHGSSPALVVLTLQLSFLSVREQSKACLLLHLLREVVKPAEQTVVFVASKHHVDFLREVCLLCGFSLSCPSVCLSVCLSVCPSVCLSNDDGYVVVGIVVVVGGGGRLG